MTFSADKRAVKDFWESASCGEDLHLHGIDDQAYERQKLARYELEPFIHDFAGFATAKGKRVLEVGVGLGADHEQFAERGADLFGIDLTERAIVHTQRRLAQRGLHSVLQVGDAESLPFAAESFDVVYSWGVIHHSPDTAKAVREIHRVLRRGGEARVMIYHRRCLLGAMLWARYALARGRPWLTLDHIYAHHLESPGTKAYTDAAARDLFADFAQVTIRHELSVGDLLAGGAGQRHRGPLLTLASSMWPRRLIRRHLRQYGLFMLITARK